MKNARRSPLGLMVLAMLGEEPMHTYRMQRLIRERGKDRVVNVRDRASLYQTIDRLLRLDLIAVRETVRGDKHPDRIVYAITDRGRDAARDWLREMLRTVGADFPDFPAGVSVLTVLTPDDARAQLAARAAAVRDALDETEAEMRSAAELPRLFLLEEDYRRTLLASELAWLDAVIADLDNGRLTWPDRWLPEPTTPTPDAPGPPPDPS